MIAISKTVAERKYIRILRELSKAEDWQYHMGSKSEDDAIYGAVRVAGLEGRLDAFRDIFGFSTADVARMKRMAGYKTLEQKYGL